MEKKSFTKSFVGLHFAIKRLQKLLERNPGADWAKEWIDCLAYLCSCKECCNLLEKNDVDVPMIDKVFST